MKSVAVLGLLLPLCLAIRVKEFVYESDILGGGPDSEQSEEHVFAYDNEGEAFNWNGISSEVLGAIPAPAYFDIPKSMFAKYSVPKEEHLVSNVVGDEGITAGLNEFADKLIENFGALIAAKGMDPAQLPNQTFQFIWRFDLYDGWIQDLATISRLSDVIASYKSQTRTLKIALPLQFYTLTFSYRYDRHAIFHHKGAVQGKIEKVKIDCHLSYNYATYKVHLEKFDIRDSGSISVHFTGQGPVDWITDALVNSLSFFLHPIVLDVIQLVIRSPIQHIVDGVNDVIGKIFTP